MLDNKNLQVFNKNSEIIDKIILLSKLNSTEKEKIILKNREKVKEYDIKKIYLLIKDVIYE
jgi:hypothetical protein